MGHGMEGTSILWMALECVVARQPKVRPWNAPWNERMLHVNHHSTQFIQKKEKKLENDQGKKCPPQIRAAWGFVHQGGGQLLVRVLATMARNSLQTSKFEA